METRILYPLKLKGKYGVMTKADTKAGWKPGGCLLIVSILSAKSKAKSPADIKPMQGNGVIFRKTIVWKNCLRLEDSNCLGKLKHLALRQHFFLKRFVSITVGIFSACLIIIQTQSTKVFILIPPPTPTLWGKFQCFTKKNRCTIY